jgi:hypothetical protein
MLSSKSREHRLRVLENQAKLAAHDATASGQRGDPQMKMPLIVEVKAQEGPRQRVRRSRSKRPAQPEFGDI